MSVAKCLDYPSKKLPSNAYFRPNYLCALLKYKFQAVHFIQTQLFVRSD